MKIKTGTLKSKARNYGKRHAALITEDPHPDRVFRSPKHGKLVGIELHLLAIYLENAFKAGLRARNRRK
jgi:hypothetical protein